MSLGQARCSRYELVAGCRLAHCSVGQHECFPLHPEYHRDRSESPFPSAISILRTSIKASVDCSLELINFCYPHGHRRNAANNIRFGRVPKTFRKFVLKF